jgi:YfiH family protein
MSTAGDWRWHSLPIGGALVDTSLEHVARHLFVGRDLDVRANPEEAYARLAAHLAVEPADIVRVRQVHGRTVLRVAPGTVVPEAPEADAIVSIDPARVISVRVADCVPILLADRHQRVIAAIHAGWRGTCAGIVAATVETIEAEGVAAADLVAAIGPSIGPCCYQVDGRVRTAFLAVHPEAPAWLVEDGVERWKLDLWAANRDQLLAAGLDQAHVSVSGVCTAHHPDRCFSHRAGGPDAGRMVAAVAFSPR